MGALLSVCIMGAGVHLPVAHAAAYGELARIGKFGEGPGEFDFPEALAVDSETNDVFVVDEPKRLKERSVALAFRIQEFPPNLTSSIASATITVGFPPGRFVAGLAVDAELHRLYVLIAQLLSTELVGVQSFANEIRVYSTDASGGVLPEETAVKSAAGKAGVAYEFPEVSSAPVPPNGLIGPEGLTVDPVTHELVVLGLHENSKASLIQKIAAGKAEPTKQYEDTEHKISEFPALGLSAGHDGSLYVMGQAQLGGLGRVVKVSPDFSTFTKVFEGLGAEKPFFYAGKEATSSASAKGSQIAVSPDGSGPNAGIAYAFEASKFEQGEKAGNYEVRGLSASSGLQQMIYGGNEWAPGSEKCTIASDPHAVAAGSNGIVYVLDDGFSVFTPSTGPTPYGFSLIEFGPGGGNCPGPSTSVSVSAKGKPLSGEPIQAQKGEELELAASSAELGTEKPTKLVWEATGAEAFTVESKEESGKPASLVMKRKFVKPGLYTVTLNMTVSPGTLGSPPPVTRQIEVKALPPRAAFEAFVGAEPVLFGQMLKSGQEVTFNAGTSEDPTGGPNGEPTNVLKTYTWDFGDGSPVAHGKEVKHAFANAGSGPIQREVKLTVTNEEGVESAPLGQSLTIEGTPTPPPPPPPPPPPGPGPGTTATPPPPAPKPKPLTRQQKLALALKACRKVKSKKARTRCESAAKRKYGPKRRSKKK
jgi:hypothetical protein